MDRAGDRRRDDQGAARWSGHGTQPYGPRQEGRQAERAHRGSRHPDRARRRAGESERLPTPRGPRGNARESSGPSAARHLATHVPEQRLRLPRRPRDPRGARVRHPHPLPGRGVPGNGAQPEATTPAVGGRAGPLLDESFPPTPCALGEEARQLPRAGPVRLCVDRLSGGGTHSGPLTAPPISRTAASADCAEASPTGAPAEGEAQPHGPPDMLRELRQVELGHSTENRFVGGSDVPREGLDRPQRTGGRACDFRMREVLRGGNEQVRLEDTWRRLGVGFRMGSYVMFGADQLSRGHNLERGRANWYGGHGPGGPKSEDRVLTPAAREPQPCRERLHQGLPDPARLSQWPTLRRHLSETSETNVSLHQVRSEPTSPRQSASPPKRQLSLPTPWLLGSHARWRALRRSDTWRPSHIQSAGLPPEGWRVQPPLPRPVGKGAARCRACRGMSFVGGGTRP